MKLKEYLWKERIDPMEFAVGVGVCLSTIYRIIRGERCYRKTAVKIEKATKGQVRVEDLVDENA